MVGVLPWLLQEEDLLDASLFASIDLFGFFWLLIATARVRFGWEELVHPLR